MKIKDIMATNLITIDKESTLHDALSVFTEKNISGAPVVEKGKIIGLITELDIIRVLDIYTPKVHFSSMPSFFLVLAGLRSKKKATELKKKIMAASKLKVVDCMTKDPVVIEKGSHILDATRLIDTYKVNRLPVVDSEKKIVGIVTRNDLIKAVARLDLEMTKRSSKRKKK